MITDNEIIKDLKNIMAKIEWMAVTYKNNDIWKQVDKKLENILTIISKDKKVYGY